MDFRPRLRHNAMVKADSRLPDFSDPELDLRDFVGREMPVRVLGNQLCEFGFDGYAADANRADFHGALENFLKADDSVLRAATAPLFQYYVDMNSQWDTEDEEYLELSHLDDVWKHVSLGDRPRMRRRPRDGEIYVSVECGCAWEPEHGLQLVFRNGRSISKLGPFNGHLSNADAYGRPELESVIYRGYDHPPMANL